MDVSQVEANKIDFLYQGSTGGGPEFPGLLAAHMNEYFKPHRSIAAEDVRVVGSATAMHNILAWALADHRDGFLTSRPVYGRLELDFFNMSGVKVVYADSDFDNCFNEDVVERFETALEDSNARGIKIKAVFIINPHNPLGWCCMS
jgi:aspartate/methionine/tyrosine aminotransferase